MPQFNRYLGIDYSGAEVPTQSLKGLRVYEAVGENSPTEVMPPLSPRKFWTRKGLAEWLAGELIKPTPTLVGIDHAFSFPTIYFAHHGLPPDWPKFLDDFQLHWPTDGDNTYVDFVRDGVCGNGAARMGDPSWYRLTERWTPAAKSVFLFDVQGQVSKSTHAGLPWLRYLRQKCGKHLHFWPFDGWEIPSGRSAVAEVYPSLWMRPHPADMTRTKDQHAAFSAASWLQRADQTGSLNQFLNPPLLPGEMAVAEIEGWILGVD